MASSTDDAALDLAAWKVTTSKVNANRLPELKVNLLRQTNASLAQDCLAATVGSYLTLTDLPDNAPATSMSVFVEGWSQVIGLREWSISYFTSPEPLLDSDTPLRTLRADAAPSSATALDAGLVIPL